jgi:hypothetical protein
MSNHEILKIADQAGLTPVVEMFEDEVVKFSQLIASAAIEQLITQMLFHGIDEANNPAFYKALENTEKRFGVKR